MFNTSLLKLIVTIICISLLSACGGENSGSNPSPVNMTPTANAGADQTVDENTVVILSASGSDADGTIASYRWIQLTGTTVTLADADAAITNFTTPTLTTSENLSFSLTVTDNEGAIANDTVVITINPAVLLITDIVFSDTNLQACIDKGASNNSWTTVSQFIFLTCNTQAIVDLSGIENLTALTILYLGNNQISDISAIIQFNKCLNNKFN